MGFKEIRLGIEEIFDTRVQDETGREIAHWKVLKRDFPDALRIMCNKFGVPVKIKDKRDDKDLDWVK